MKNKTIFVKVSGDLFLDPVFFEKLVPLYKKAAYLLICVGGGSQINDALETAGFTLKLHGPLGRELKTMKERVIARDVLRKNRETLKEHLRAKFPKAVAIMPVIEKGPVICHINGDELVRTMYNGFDELHVFTRRDRVEKKRIEFHGLPKVKVIGIEA